MSGVYAFGAIISSPYLFDCCYKFNKQHGYRKDYLFVYSSVISICAWPISVPLFMYKGYS